MMYLVYLFLGILVIIIVIPFLFGVGYGVLNLFYKPKGFELYSTKLEMIKRELKDSFIKYEYKRFQEVNYQFKWLLNLDSWRSTLYPKEKQSKYLAKIEVTNLDAPSELDISKFDHYIFSKMIIEEFRKSLSENEFEYYKPNDTLPFPKIKIMNSILLGIEYINLNKMKLSEEKRNEEITSLKWLKETLNRNFIEADIETLPKNGLDNFGAGKVYENQH